MRVRITLKYHFSMFISLPGPPSPAYTQADPNHSNTLVTQENLTTRIPLVIRASARSRMFMQCHMHADIASFPNARFYAGALRTGASVRR